MFDLLTTVPPIMLDAKVRTEIMAEVSAAVRTDREFPVEVLRSPTDQDRRRIEARIAQLVGNAVRRRGLSRVNFEEEQMLCAEIGRRSGDNKRAQRNADAVTRRSSVSAPQA